MVEQIVAFTLGFCICGLICLSLLPLVSARARRLPLAKIEERLPMTLDEIEADRDLLRANFAVEKRGLEIKAQAALDAKAADAAELGRRAGEIARLGEKIEQLSCQLRETGEAHARAQAFGVATEASLHETRATLEAREEDLRARHAEYDALAASHRALDNRAGDLDAGFARTTEELRLTRSHLETARAARAEISSQRDQITAEIEALKAQLREAQERDAAFEARRERLMARIEGERKRIEELEAECAFLRQRLEQGGGEARPSPGETEMLDLRAAIARIGHDVAQLDKAN